MKKTNYSAMAAGLYFNFAILGIATIIISQYSNWFSQAWNTDVQGVSLVLSMVGLGRILTILFAGVISDKIGRKKTMMISMLSNALFLLGIGFVNNIVLASIAALFFGVTNSFGDSAAYPAMTEAFPKRAATMNSLLKAAMSVAQFLFPFWVAAIQNARLTVLLLAILLIGDAVFLASSNFASQNEAADTGDETTDNVSIQTTQNKPKMAIDGTLLIMLGFTICFTFYVFSQYAPQFGSVVLGASATASRTLVSWYAMASMISVFLTAFIVTKTHPLNVILVYSAVSFVALAIMIIHPTLTTARIGSIVIGFFGAGGLWQLGLSVLTEYFPKGRGKITSYYSSMAALTYFLGPLVSSMLIKDTANSVLMVFITVAAMALISIVGSTVLILRKRNFEPSGGVLIHEQNTKN
ncbi:MFS transporter [Tetragenococcus solitarius]|uniref:MFS transporter n=1 Tax=Tetragenococcus solitarius TaxID=71453 RepID=A0ABN3Y329_9ENTE|nr:MFS transporter [Tetragenococcus solitarius]